MVAAGADRPSRHLLVVSSTSYNSTVPGPPAQILLFDRETGAQTAHFDFPGRAYAPAVTPDGGGLYIVATGEQAGIGVVDLGAAAMRSFLSLPNVQGGFAVADDRILVTTATGITALDTPASRVLASVPCPAFPQHLIYNGANGAAYATMIGRQDLCVVTPDLDPAAPLPTPLGAHEIIDATVLLENNLLLVTTYAGGVGPYKSYAVDLIDGNSASVPSLDTVFPASLAPDDPTVLYGWTPAGAMSYKLTLGPDGFPAFTPQAAQQAVFHDDRYAYAGVAGSCSTPEGPVTCLVGFRMLDPATMTEVRSFVFAQQTSFGLFAPRAISLSLSVVRPFGSSVSRPRRSRR